MPAKFSDEQIAEVLRGVEVSLTGEVVPPNRERAIAWINSCFDKWEKETITADSPLSATGINLRTVNQLEAAGILTIKQLIATPVSDFFLMPNMGVKTVEDMDRAIRKHGFALDRKLHSKSPGESKS